MGLFSSCQATSSGVAFIASQELAHGQGRDCMHKTKYSGGMGCGGGRWDDGGLVEGVSQQVGAWRKVGEVNGYVGR